MFIRLKKNFRPIVHDDYYELFDNDTVREYELDEDQYDLVIMLDGTRTEDDILGQYDDKSQGTVNNFINKLASLNALDYTDAPIIRVFPVDQPVPYLEAVLWDITSLCNLECTHCYVSEYSQGLKGSDLTNGEVMAVIDEMVAMNVRDASITGGEPLMRKDILDIILRITDTDIRLASLFTNGIAVKPDFVEALHFLAPSKFRIRHSLDGMTPEANAVLRGNKMEPAKLFDRMVGSIKMFVEAGFNVSVGTGMHYHNIHDLLEMYNFMKDLGLEQWRMAVPKPIGRFVQTQETIGASWEKILSAYRDLIDLHLSEVKIDHGKIVAPINIEIEQVFRTELVQKTMNTFKVDDIVCFYHKNRCSIKANGEVVPCGYFDCLVTGNVRNGGLRQAWESEKMQKIKHLCISDISECQDCSLLAQCGTGCRAVAEKIHCDINTKDPYACHQTQFLKEVVIPLFQKHGFTLKMSHGCSEFSVTEQEVI